MTITDRARELLHTCGKVRRVANGRVVDAEAIADPAHDDRPGIEPHPNRNRRVGRRRRAESFTRDRLLDGQCRQGGAARVILVRQRRAEQRHEPVAEELVDGALVAVHLGQRDREERIEEWCMTSGPTRSARAVEPTRSQNRTVTCFSSPRQPPAS